MDHIKQILAECSGVIDGECDSTTPEYRALDLLHSAVESLFYELLERDRAIAHAKGTP